ncbi:hypothetical protein [Streptomyces sp. NPDC046197]|uniref:hypothetical protein n=1 Tax=Streptomyces sp. NPDC046197 TaxID=3154337 RepID=UPI0033EB0D2E
MSMPPETHGVPPAGGALQGSPNVYHPQAAAAPAYEGYADPAAAHGWQNAYDETRELPPVPGGETRELPPVPDVDAPGRQATEGVPEARQGHRGRPRGRRMREQRGGGRSRRAALVAGAAGVVSLAVIAGFSALGSSSDGPQGARERTGPTAGGADTTAGTATASAVTGSPAGPAGAGVPDTGGGRSGSAPASASAVGSPAASGSGDRSAPPATTPAPGTSAAAATPAPATSAPVTSAPAGRGHGRGANKRPK